MKKNKAKKITVILAISIPLLIFMGFVLYMVFGYGTLIFWIHNYEPPCNNTNSTCKNFTYNAVYIDNVDESHKISDGVSISGGETWSTEIRATAGPHKIVFKNEGDTLKVLVDIQGGKTTCFELAIWWHIENDPGYYNSTNCP
jgi:hypothetical protein